MKLLKKITFSTKFLLGAFVFSSLSFVYTAVGAPPGSPYIPGESLAPTCSPGDANCTVDTLNITATDTTTSGDLYISTYTHQLEPSANQDPNTTRGAFKAHTLVPATAVNDVEKLEGLAAFIENESTVNIGQMNGVIAWTHNKVNTTIGSINGGFSGSQHDAGSVFNLGAIDLWSGAYGGTVANHYGIDIAIDNGGATITDRYGIRINAFSGSATNDYGIYQAGTAQKNYFAGNIGIGTSSPVEMLDIVNEGDADLDLTTYEGLVTTDNSTIHLNFANGTIAVPTVAVDGETIGEFKSAIWDGTGFSTATNIAFRVDTTGAVSGTSTPGEIRFLTVPIDSTTQVDRMIIRSDGRVGIGTTSPSSSAQAEIQKEGGGDVLRLDAQTSGNSTLVFETDVGSNSARISGINGLAQTEMAFEVGGNERVRIDGAGNVGIGTTLPSGKLDVNGSIYQRGGVLYADYVFEDDYNLESIVEHSEFMWSNKHLPAVPGIQYDENGLEILEIGAQRKGILEELEKAHVYIEQLNQMIQEQNQLILSQEVRLEALEELLQ